MIQIDPDQFFGSTDQSSAREPFTRRRGTLLEASRAFLTYYRGIIREGHREGASGRQVVEATTIMTDVLLQTLFRLSLDPEERGEGTCLIALGGYGRGELNPLSDIDLMFYTGSRDRADIRSISERILYLLWDLGLDVGFSVRTEKDCLDMAERDLTARTALLDSRFVAGDQTLYAEFDRNVFEPVMSRNSQGFIREKLEENATRLKKYGSSVYLLEPNLKEGEGGLRDLHTAVWVARIKFKARTLKDLLLKGVLTEKEHGDILAACDYLWRIRNELHFLSARRNDQLQFEHQEKIAQFLGYRDQNEAAAVEQFMQDYYEHATRVEHCASYLIAKAVRREEPSLRLFGNFSRRNLEDGFFIQRGELWTAGADLFAREPARMMQAFALAQKHGVNLSFPVKTQIRENLTHINDRVRRSREMSEWFLDILRARKGVGRILREMHHLRFLNRFIPEFRNIYCKVQYDAYHIYTVDIHSLFAVEEICRLWDGECRAERPELTQVAGEIEKGELLLLAVLFHDIGKGEGKDHCNKGAALIPTIARRLGLNREDSQRLEFLVRNHLLMAHIAQRRDLHDDRQIMAFAKQMEMSENLRMLYLLTYADIKAVGPGVWTEWKARLLQELFEKSYQILERGNFQFESGSEKVRKRKREVLELLKGELGERAVREVLKTLSTRYLLSYRAAEIAAHLRFAAERGERSVLMKVEHDPSGAYTQISISTLDVPGLFSLITGVMAANGLNILGAQIHTRFNGEVLDILQVQVPDRETAGDPGRWRKLEEDLVKVIEGRVRVDALVARRRKPAFLAERRRPQFASRVEINNEVSDNYTVLDIYAHDRVGLLYEITRTLKELGLYIGVAKISTKVDQVTDTFYVQDIFGQKVRQGEKMEEVRARLVAVLDRKDEV